MAPRLAPHYEEMVALSRAGMSRKSVAEKIGCSPAVVSKIALLHGVPKFHERTAGCEPHREAIIDLVARGYGFPMITRKLRVSNETLRSWASDNAVRAIPRRYQSVVLRKSILPRLKAFTGRPTTEAACVAAIADHFGIAADGAYPATIKRYTRDEINRIAAEAVAERQQPDTLANRLGIHITTAQEWFSTAGFGWDRLVPPPDYRRINLDFHGPFYAEMERRLGPERLMSSELITILNRAAS